MYDDNDIDLAMMPLKHLNLTAIPYPIVVSTPANIPLSKACSYSTVTDQKRSNAVEANICWVDHVVKRKVASFMFTDQGED